MMAYSLIIEPEAESDLADAYQWYEDQRPGLGREFFQSVEEVFQRIVRAPEIHARAYKTARQTLVRRFPYVVCYVAEADCVYVIAVFHGHRDPVDWQSRMEALHRRPQPRIFTTAVNS